MIGPKTCESCGLKPEAFKARRWCYDCKPGSNGRPLPCRRCGKAGDYWAGRLCRGCHPHAPQRPESCRDCLAWGVTRLHNWTCQACTSWRFLHPGTGTCISCQREVAINDRQACRLCWMQTFEQQARRGQPRDVLEANRHGQQIWFADMIGYRNGTRPPRRDYRRRRDQIDPPAQDTTTVGAEPITVHPDQGDLFAYDPVADPAHAFGFGEPPSARFAAHLDGLVLEHAEHHGWTHRATTRTRITVRVLQARHRIQTPPITTSAVLDLRAHGLPVRLAMLVLDQAGILLDDQSPTLETWFERQITGLPEPMTAELRTWFQVLRHGSPTPPRSHPRAHSTISLRTRWAMPTLRAWASNGHQSLREITRADVLAVLPSEGTPRVKLGTALRSILTTLKKHRVLFTNPTARLRIGNFERRIPMPVDLEPVKAAFDSTDPTTAAIAALVAVHGLRPSEATTLLMTQVRDHRIQLPDRTILLAPATKSRLDAYLAHRHRRWPATINPHFLVHTKSALTTEPVRVPWLADKLGTAPQSLRQDRILAEVHAGADQRRICDLFGVTIATAEHYTATLNHPDLDDFTTTPPSPRTGTPT